MKLIDTHAHLDFEHYHEDRAKICARASSELQAVINVGTSAASCKACLDLSYKYANFYATVGLHPNDALSFNDKDWAKIEAIATDPRVVAIGETGLDLYRDVPLIPQKKLLEKHLELANKVEKPVILHCREATQELLDFINQWSQTKPMPLCLLHCFSQSEQVMQRYVSIGFYIAVGGAITYKNSQKLYPMLKNIPSYRLMLETDAPFLPPQSHRGERNEPSYIIETAQKVAEIREVSLSELTEHTTQNAIHFFNLPNLKNKEPQEDLAF
ncbi:MAG: TatD family hydrolase [Chloroflexi bacterium]|nr:TatD family hydrolase [Chloroflexota bacterium]